MNLNYVSRADNLVQVRNVLLSVADKSGLEQLIAGLMKSVPEVVFYSTGGTYTRVAEILGEQALRHLRRVADYTGQPEMQGGLVKTLDFKIYLGLLSETYNSVHRTDLERLEAVDFDMTVVNLYPFEETVAQTSSTIETARANIDIGGPCMLRASAKNFLRVAAVCDPQDYATVLRGLEQREGCTSLDERFELAKKAFAHTAGYDRAVTAYLEQFKSVRELGIYDLELKEQ